MGQSSSRRLISSEQAYRQAILECEKEDSLLNGKKGWLEKQMTDVDDTLRAINLNYATAHETLTTAYQNAVLQLQGMTKQKLDCVLSAELELRRQYEQVMWGESFISNAVNMGNEKAQGPSLDQKVDFLRIWKSHVVHRNAICRFKTVETDVLKNMKPDIVVEAPFKVGKIEILNEPMTTTPVQAIKHQASNRLSKRADTIDGGPIEQMGGVNITDLSQRPTATFVDHANKIGLFDYPVISAEDLVASSAKLLIDANSSKLQDAVADATKDPNGKFPLPPSFTTPFAAGIMYPVPGTVDLKDTDRQDGKQQFELVFKKAIGEPHCVDILQGTSI